MKILVVTASGQLGFGIAKKAIEAGYDTYGLHRKTSNINALKKLPCIKLVEGDLTDYSSMVNAVKGKDVIIGCANTAAPVQKDDTFNKVDLQGFFSLIEICKNEGVKQFIYTSAISFGELDLKIYITKIKRKVENRLKESGLNYTIFRPAAFMDIYFAFMGTDIVLYGSEVHTLERNFPFSRKFFNGIKNDIALKGKFNYIGKGDKRISFIAVEDVADFHVNAINNPVAFNRTITIGGPQALSPLDVKVHFEKAYNKPLKGKSTPAFIIKLMSGILSLFNKHAANIMAMNYAGTVVETTIPDAMQTAKEFDITLTSCEKFIQQKLS